MARKQIFLIAGNFLIAMSILGFLLTFGKAFYYEIKYRFEQAKGISYQVVEEESSALGEILRKQREQEGRSQSLFAGVIETNTERILVPPSAEFSVVVPKIGASERVTPNVDPSNKNEYLKVLQDSIAHAKGSSLPGLNGTTYLFAHSADNWWNVGRYNAVFYLLGKLENGDDIYLFFNGKRYNYTVYDKKVVNPNEVDYLDSKIGEGERLILQTCWPPGTTWKRELIFAKLKNT